MTIQEAQQQLIVQLQQVYENREAANITDWVMEHLTGWKRIDRIVHHQLPLLPPQAERLEQITADLLAHKPVQYVLHEAWFAGMNLYVDENVLIPRPETEELVELVRSQESGVDSRIVLDIGTGSGCIPIALKKKLPRASVYACDVSEGALAVARKNAAAHETAIEFVQLDFLDTTTWTSLPAVDVIVSNPPYIPQQDASTMNKNVLDYEPHLALFVANNDPLLFYKAIAGFALLKLLPGGTIYAEIHEDLGTATRALFLEKGFTEVEVRKDLQEKDRMIRVRK
jgi:release factor glutamine methyltransferase